MFKIELNKDIKSNIMLNAKFMKFHNYYVNIDYEYFVSAFNIGKIKYGVIAVSDEILSNKNLNIQIIDPLYIQEYFREYIESMNCNKIAYIS